MHLIAVTVQALLIRLFSCSSHHFMSPQHVLAAVKTPKVSRMQMELDPETCQILICLTCQNGGCRVRSLAPLPLHAWVLCRMDWTRLRSLIRARPPSVSCACRGMR